MLVIRQLMIKLYFKGFVSKLVSFGLFSNLPYTIYRLSVPLGHSNHHPFLLTTLKKDNKITLKLIEFGSIMKTDMMYLS